MRNPEREYFVPGRGSWIGPGPRRRLRLAVAVAAVTRGSMLENPMIEQKQTEHLPLEFEQKEGFSDHPGSYLDFCLTTSSHIQENLIN